LFLSRHFPIFYFDGGILFIFGHSGTHPNYSHNLIWINGIFKRPNSLMKWNTLPRHKNAYYKFVFAETTFRKTKWVKIYYCEKRQLRPRAYELKVRRAV
jgi:hypothetical protein